MGFNSVFKGLIAASSWLIQFNISVYSNAYLLRWWINSQTYNYRNENNDDDDDDDDDDDNNNNNNNNNRIVY